MPKSSCSRIHRPLSKVSFYLSVLLVGLGILATFFVLSQIWLAQSDCQSGLGPVPDQGCGYVPQLVLFVWGDYSTLLLGLYMIYAGCVVFVIRWKVNELGHHPADDDLRKKKLE